MYRIAVLFCLDGCLLMIVVNFRFVLVCFVVHYEYSDHRSTCALGRGLGGGGRSMGGCASFYPTRPRRVARPVMLHDAPPPFVFCWVEWCSVTVAEAASYSVESRWRGRFLAMITS